MKYQVFQTDTADSLIRGIILYIAENFGSDIALEKLEELETAILSLNDDPPRGIIPKAIILKRQGYRVLILKKDLVFYQINEERKEILVYAVTDQLQEYLSILRGL